MNKKELLTFQETCNFLNLKESRLRTAIRKREIPYVKVGHLIRFRITELMSWVDKNTVRKKEL